MQEARTRNRSHTSARVAMGTWLLLAAGIILSGPTAVDAEFYTGTVHFQGQVVFDQPIAGIGPEDLTVSVGATAEPTGQGEKCEILSSSADNADLTGAYPDTGDVSVGLKIERGGGGKWPVGDCIVSVLANGTDGVSVSASGALTAFATAIEIDTSALVSLPDLTVRESKAVAGLDTECLKWATKELKYRDKCNFLLLKKGPEIADKCKTADPEPADCDPGEHVAAIVALAHDAVDQQTDPPSALAIVDEAGIMRDQKKCQKMFGKGAVGFARKRLKLVQKRCVDAGTDSVDCRADRSNDAKKKIDKVDKCVAEQAVDDGEGGTGIMIPVVGDACTVCIDAGVVDRKCLKSCFNAEVGQLTDGIMGDIPVCGNGILQSGEACDDGNNDADDCCSPTCAAELPGEQSCGLGECLVTVAKCLLGEPVTCTPDPAGVEGPSGDPTCSDGLDNDCDDLIDEADPGCDP